MSRLYFKHTFSYDSNESYDEICTIYEEINNSTDTRYFYNEYGNYIKLCGTDNYIDKLSYILRNEDTPDIKTVSIDYNEFHSIFNNNH